MAATGSPGWPHGLVREVGNGLQQKEVQSDAYGTRQFNVLLCNEWYKIGNDKRRKDIGVTITDNLKPEATTNQAELRQITRAFRYRDRVPVLFIQLYTQYLCAAAFGICHCHYGTRLTRTCWRRSRDAPWPCWPAPEQGLRGLAQGAEADILGKVQTPG
jgi:hypothetical protein